MTLEPIPCSYLFSIRMAVYIKYYGLATSKAYIWINMGSGNGMLPDGTKPFLEPMLTYPELTLYVLNFSEGT